MYQCFSFSEVIRKLKIMFNMQTICILENKRSNNLKCFN